MSNSPSRNYASLQRPQGSSPSAASSFRALYHQPGTRPTCDPGRPKGPRYLACRSNLPELGQHRIEPSSIHGDRVPLVHGRAAQPIGLLEDRFFATVFLGSGLLFVAMLFAAAAVSRGLLETFATAGRLSADSETYAVGRAMAHALMNTFGMKMAAVFMFVTSTIGLRTAVLARWVSFVGFALGLLLLLVITDFAWIALVFPFWVLLVSTYILVTDFQHGGQKTADEKTALDNRGVANHTEIAQAINIRSIYSWEKSKNHRSKTYNSP